MSGMPGYYRCQIYLQFVLDINNWQMKQAKIRSRAKLRIKPGTQCSKGTELTT